MKKYYHFIKNLIMRNQICSEFIHIKCIANDMKISEKTVLIKIKKREKKTFNKWKKVPHVGFSDWVAFQN